MYLFALKSLKMLAKSKNEATIKPISINIYSGFNFYKTISVVIIILRYFSSNELRIG